MYAKLAEYCKKYDMLTPAECVDYNMSRIFSIIKEAGAINSEWNLALRYFSNCLGAIIDARLFSESEYINFIQEFKIKFSDSYKDYDEDSKLFLNKLNDRIIKFLNAYRYSYIRDILGMQELNKNLDDLIIDNKWLNYIRIPFIPKYYLNFVHDVGLWEISTYERRKLTLNELLSLVN